MGPPSCMRSVVDQNVVMRRITEPRTKDAFVQSSSTLTLSLLTYTFIHVHKLFIIRSSLSPSKMSDEQRGLCWLPFMWSPVQIPATHRLCDWSRFVVSHIFARKVPYSTLLVPITTSCHQLCVLCFRHRLVVNRTLFSRKGSAVDGGP